MASMSMEALEQELDLIVASYNAGFAGQPRAPRDLAELAGLIRRLRDVLLEIDRLPAAAPDSARSRLIADTRSRLATYESEYQAIQEAKAAGTEFGEFSQLAAFANFVFARYRRHFAGQDRGSRDRGLLTEMVEELEAIRQRMSVILVVQPSQAFERDAEVVTNMTAMYKQELREIAKAQAAGTAEEQSSKLAQLANAQFERYRRHFVGQARVTRRPAMLQWIIENLRRIRVAMRDLRASVATAQANRENISIVDSNLRLHEAELAEIRKARQATAMRDILDLLGGAANAVFEEYRSTFAGQDRRTVDLDALSALCDKLGEIARQMADLGRTEHNARNQRNLEIVIEQLGDYEQEFRAIAKVQMPEQ